MAHHSATLKNIRKIAAQTERNTARRSRIRTFVKKLEAAIESKNHEESSALFKQTQKELQRGVSKGVYKKNTAARKISRLNSRIKLLAKK